VKFGNISIGQEAITISIPGWMSREMLEMFGGGIVGGLTFGAVSGAIKSSFNVGKYAGLVDMGVNALGSLALYKFINKYPKLKYFLFGGVVVGVFAFLKGLFDLIFSIAGVGAQMIDPLQARYVGEMAVAQAFAPIGVPKATPPVTAPQTVSYGEGLTAWG